MAKKHESIGRVTTPDGRSIDVFGESGKYWLCKGCQFRKSHVVFAEKKRKTEKEGNEG